MISESTNSGVADRSILSLDLETYSDIELKSCGMYKYVEGDFHILLLAYAFNDDPVKIVDLASGEEIPKEVIDAIFDDNIIKIAWNAQFERTCLSKYFGVQLSPDSWQCSMVLSASLSLPLALEDAAKVLKVSEQKDKEGERLIKYYSVPCKPTKENGGRTRNLPQHEKKPGDWQKFKDYCLQDVRTERAIRKKLERFPMPEHEWDYYHMDQRINDRGVLIDTTLIKQAIRCDQIQSEIMLQRAYELTGLENPNSVAQLKSWLEGRDIPVESLNKKNVTAMISDLDKNSTDQEALDMLKLRLQMAKSSIKKYQAAERCVCRDGRARGLFQFSGASRTARWSGRFIQLQNLFRNEIDTLDEARELIKSGNFDMVASIYGNVPDILSQLIRTMLIPKPGCEFIIADFSSIEARVLAWLSGEQWRLDAFKRGEDIYCASASAMFGVPVVKHGINGELRQKGKIAELACGYGGGSTALNNMGALDMGLKEDELPKLIKDWRQANPNIVKFWWDLEAAVKETVKDHQERTIGKINIEFYANTLWIVLPSGRKLAYINPKLEPNRFGRMSMVFIGPCEAKKGERTKKFGRNETYGGKLAENITQATSRDLLAEAMWRIEQAGLDIVTHVHDEVILEVSINTVSVDDVCKIMNQNPAWAEGLPLNSAGYIGEKFYFKD